MFINKQIHHIHVFISLMEKQINYRKAFLFINLLIYS